MRIPYFDNSLITTLLTVLGFIIRSQEEFGAEDLDEKK